MPEMDGYEACKKIREDPNTQDIPVVMVTALFDRESRIKGLEAGANDFLTKPVDNTELIVRSKNLLKVKEYSDFLKSYSRILKEEVDNKTSEIKKGYLDTIVRLTRVAEYKDEETASHIKRVGYYTALIAEELGWSKEDIDTILHAAPMHDIGKVGIASELLLKRGMLNNAETKLMKAHTIIGGKVLEDSISPFLQMAQRIALSHHEHWNGSGYPNGLKGKDIPIDGRIMTIADQYDALRSQRPYKPAINHEISLKIISEGDERSRPEHFDPLILEAFKDNHRKFDEIFEQHRE